MSDEQLKIEYVPLSKIKEWPGNAREWDLGAVHESINEFGFRDPLAVNSKNNQIEEGHGRINVLLQKKSARNTPPKWIVEDGDEWLVPVMWFTDETEIQERYALAHNRSQDLGSYDLNKLAKELKKHVENDALAGTGYSADDLDDMLKLVNDNTTIDADTNNLSLRERFLIPPFSVFDARQGYWQERKRLWLSLGIQSELGRGGAPGGSPRPAVQQTGQNGTVRGNGHGRPLKRLTGNIDCNSQSHNKKSKGKKYGNA